MNSNLSRIFGQFLLRKQSLPSFRINQRFYATKKNDNGNSDRPSSSDKKDSNETSADSRQHLLDVTEYYSQYIKEYEQGGFKDEESVQWELRREKIRMTRGRGQTGVMDVDEVVEFLRAERIADICTLRMPKMDAYAAHMIIGTPLSRRHLNAMTEKFMKAYKKKRAAYDPLSLRTEDVTNPEWRVLDLGNVVVHLMMPAARKRYDIEMLWAVGPEHDELTNEAGELDEYGDRLKKLQEDIDSLSNSTQDSDARQKKM